MIMSDFFKAEADVEQFMKENHTFDEYAREVRKYHRLVDEISYNCVKVGPTLNSLSASYHSDPETSWA